MKSMRNKPKYCVVIPTRNRQKYCVEAVRSVTMSERKDVELIVLDNSDDDSLKAILASEGLTSQLRYVPPEDRILALHHNWERAWDLITAQWVIFIGDDDGCTANTFKVLDFLTSKFAFEAYKWPTLNYKWPCFPTSSKGILDFPLDMIGVTIQDSKSILAKCATWQNAVKWPDLGPTVYHGLVSINIIKKIKDRHGIYFSDFNADYASSILNLSVLDKYLFYMTPLTIMGASGRSNSAALTGAEYKQQGTSEYEKEIKREICDYKEFSDSRLAVPIVASGFRRVFDQIDIPFLLKPDRLMVSCINELSKIRDPDIFAIEQKRMIKFAKNHRLDVKQIRAMKAKKEDRYIGMMPNRKQYYIDTIPLGVKGITDLNKIIPSFIQNYQEAKTLHTRLLTNFRKQAGALLR